MEERCLTPGSKISKNDDGRQVDLNLLRFHGDAAASAVEEAAINYQSPSIIVAGANAQNVSVLATLVNLCLSILCLKAPALIERLGQTKRGAVLLSFLNMLVWVPLIFACLFSSQGIVPIWLALLWLVNVMPGILLSFQRDNWISNLVPQKGLGRYLGQRLAIKSAFYLGAFISLGFMLDAFGQNNLASLAFVFIVALIMAAVDFVVFTHMRDIKKKEADTPAAEPPAKVQFGLFNFIGELKEKKLDMFITFTSFFYLTVGLSGPLFAVYMLEEKHFTYLSFTLIIAAEYLARVVSAPFWGKYADKAGNIKVLGIVARIIPAIPVAWLFCSNVSYLVFVQVLSGICWGAFDLSTQSYLYKVAPKAKKLKYIVYTRCLILFSTAVGGLFGAYLVKGIFFTFGSRLLTIFMISGFFRALVVMYLMPKLVDLAVSFGKPKAPPHVAIDGQAVASKRGLFYRLQDEPTDSPVIGYNAAKLAEDMAAMRQRNQIIIDRLAKAEAAKAEILALAKNMKNRQRRNWAATEKPARAPSIREETMMLAKNTQSTPQRVWTVQEKPAFDLRTAEKPPVLKPTRRPWYGDEEIAAAYGWRPQPHLLLPKTEPGRTGGSQGLYYNESEWSSYLRQTLRSVVKDGRDRRAEPMPKPEVTLTDVPTAKWRPEPSPAQNKFPVPARVPVYVR